MSEDTDINPIDFFRVKATENASPLSRANAQRAVEALDRFVGGASISFSDFQPDFFGEWITHLLHLGYTPKTLSNNIIKRLSTLYNKAVDAGIALPNDVFRHLQARLNNDINPGITTNAGIDVFGKIQALAQTDFHAYPIKQLAKDIILFSIYMGGIGFDEITSFRKDDYKGDNVGVREIIKRYSKPRNKYLFPLDQIHSTPRQLSRKLQLIFADALAGRELQLSPDPSDTPLSLWVHLALDCGFPAADVAACVPQDKRSSVLTAFAPHAEIDGLRKNEIRETVTNTISHNPLRWFAMHFRRNADYDMLTQRLKEKNIVLDRTYYPMEEIVRKVGRRNVFENRPVISWLLFFRCHGTRLNSLFNEIGDLAWGYRYSADVRSPYAVIPDREILQYQTTLGTLTPETQIVDDDKVSFNEGDYLVILGGALDGRHAIFVEEKKAPKGKNGSKIVFRVKLGGGKNANWTVDWDPRLVRKITADEYNALDNLP